MLDLKMKWLDKYKWLSYLGGIILTAVITLLVEKSCNRIIPDDPIVIKEVSDTIQMIHSYDLDFNKDSIVNAQLKEKLENIRLTHLYEKEVEDNLKKKYSFNSIKLDTVFFKKKGYSLKNAMAYFSVKMSSIDEKFLDFEITFFDDSFIDNIYCLSININSIEDGKRYNFMWENYSVNPNNNKIRINNMLPKGVYEISIGFFLKRDLNNEYPAFYKISKLVRK